MIQLVLFKINKIQKGHHSKISTSQFVRRFQPPFLRNPPFDPACPSCRQPFPPALIRQTKLPYTYTQVHFLTIQIDFFLSWQKKKFFLHVFNIILQSKIISKCQHPLFRTPAPALYFHPFFKFFRCPPLSEVIKIHFPVNKGVKTMLMDLKKLNNSCILITCLKRSSYIALGKIILK